MTDEHDEDQADADGPDSSDLAWWNALAGDTETDRDAASAPLEEPSPLPPLSCNSDPSETVGAPEASVSPVEVAGDGGLSILALLDGHRPTDTGNADRLVAIADGRVRYVPAWGRWLVYRDGAWRIDHGDALVTEFAKRVPRRLFQMAADRGDSDTFKWAKRSESAAAIASMVRLARGVDGVVTDHQDLDSHPWLLNVVNGTVDLRTGQLGAPNPDHLITCQAPVVFDPDAGAPLWEACVARWQPDLDVRAYLQLIIGSAATGHPVEHVFVNVGGGGNGKGKFYGAVERTLGASYAVVPHKSLLIVQRHEQHDTVKARLFGARMAVAGETEAGDRLDEAKVKELTGGDLLEARRMREDPWKFRPSHTLFLHTNNEPNVTGSDEGIWRRIRRIPWDITIPAAEQDSALADKLEAESSGILNWIIAGAVAWHRNHLRFNEPQAILDATHTYRAESDTIGRFLADCCTLAPGRWASGTDMRRTYEMWCDDVGEHHRLGPQAWGAELKKRGLNNQPHGPSRRMHWEGVGLLSDTPDGPDEGMF